MSAILFGSISTVADTSELQRAAFNEAFDTHGLGWTWSREDYQNMLGSSGGENRIADYAASLGQSVDAGAVHRTKSEIFQKNVVSAGITPRAGVVDTIRAAKSSGMKVALVTTTSPANIAALGEALNAAMPFSVFDLIVDSSSVDTPKPDKAAYSFALENLQEKAADCTAIEDNAGGVQAARAADVACIAFPNENTGGSDFGEATRVVETLSLDDLVAAS